MTASRIAQLTALFLLSVLAKPAQAQVIHMPVQGGPGGDPFRSTCASGDFLVGIYVRSGAWIDAIGLKCATFNRAQGKFGHPPYNRPFHGGNGGEDHERVCPANSFITRIKFGFTRAGRSPKFIEYVQQSCRRVGDGSLTSVDCMETGEGCWEFHPTASNLRALRSECPRGAAAIGVVGRAGRFVDAIGLVCAREPR
jgi:hypothetical protein